MEEQILIQRLDGIQENQEYQIRDTRLLQSFSVAENFSVNTDYIEGHIYDLSENLLFSNPNIRSFKLSSTGTDPANNTSTVIELNVEQDVRLVEITRGSIITYYNFFRKILGSSPSSEYWIKQISSDRTELKVSSQNFTSPEVASLYAEFVLSSEQKPYYTDYQLNFGENRTLIGVNLESTVDVDGEVVLLVKLYEPLPDDLGEKSTFWFVKKLAEPVGFRVDFIQEGEFEEDATPRLRGPNFSVKLSEQENQTTPFYNLAELFSAPARTSLQQIKSLLDEKSIDINVDYTDFANFVHFSSAVERIQNFKYKLGLIESYTSDINTLANVPSTGVVNTNTVLLQSKIDAIIEKFDGYEYYLYFESGSKSWPKSNNVRPYTLRSTTSTEAVNWLGSEDTPPTPGNESILYQASRYDGDNKDYIINTIPSYLYEDESNKPYETFLQMIGHYYDNIWIYLKDVTQRYNTSNKVERGVSKDLVSTVLKGFGIELYTNTNISNNIYYSLLGISPDAEVLPPTGSEEIRDYVSSSISPVAVKDVTAEFYKRLYHNLPYLLKTRGTERGVRALINCYGIPSTLLRINEYGGVPKSGEYTGYKYNRFSLAYRNTSTTSVVFPWAPSYMQALLTGDYNVVPSAIEFRFKPHLENVEPIQTLFQVGFGTGFKFGVVLEYTPQVGPYEGYGKVKLLVNGSGGVIESSEIELPFFKEESWWTLLLQRDEAVSAASYGANTTYQLFVQNAYFNTEGIGRVGFSGSAEITIDGTTQASYNNAWLEFNPDQNRSFEGYLGGANSSVVVTPGRENFNGNFQEFRYWTRPLTKSTLDKHTLDSTDYSTDTPEGSIYELILRAPLGSNLTIPYKDAAGAEIGEKDYDLYLRGESTIVPTAVADTVHPALNGRYYIPLSNTFEESINSFINGALPYGYGVFVGLNQSSFEPTTTVELVKEPVSGISQKVTNKVIIGNQEINGNPQPVDQLLTRNTTVQFFDKNRTPSSPYLEVAYSPADNIDDDIISQLGGFNIDDLIGAPEERYTVGYRDLERIKAQYFQKYVSKFDLYDFIRLLKYIDNSLFKLIKDFTPARANLATGLVIKPHVLERSKYPRHEPTVTEIIASTSIDTGFIVGNPPTGKEYETEHTVQVQTATGYTTKYITQYESLFTGEFENSLISAGKQVFKQEEVSNSEPVPFDPGNPNRESWYFVTGTLQPLLNNVSSNRRSTKFYDLDYSFGGVLPVNLDIVLTSIDDVASGNPDYSSPYIPWAEIQDSNQSRESYTRIRYKGSRTSSRLYTSYSLGDTSYGKTAAIDKIRFQYTYLKDIAPPTLTLPSRSNAQIKYLLDDEEGVLDLTKENNNIFDIQNIYKGGETVNISLFDYSNRSTDLLTNRSISIYEGGFRYLPIAHNIAGSTAPFRWNYSQPVPIVQIIPSIATTPICTDLGDSNAYNDTRNWIISTAIDYTSIGTPITVTSIRYVGPPSTLPDGCKLRVPVVIQNSQLTNIACYLGLDPLGTTTVAVFEYGRLEAGQEVAPIPSSVQTLFCNCDTTADPDRDRGGRTRFCDPDELSARLYILSPLTVATPQGTWFLFNNATGQTQTVDLVGLCDPGLQPYTLPAGSSTLCLRVVPSGLPAGITFVQRGDCQSCNSGQTTTLIRYVSLVDDPEPCLKVPFSATTYASALGRTIKLSRVVSEALRDTNNYTITFDQLFSDPATSTDIEKVILPYTLATGDGFHFYSPAQGWIEPEEYRVVETFRSGSGPDERLYVVLNKPINLDIMTTPPTATQDGEICRYITAKHIPDETNVIIRYTPLDPALVEEGILYPQYIRDEIRIQAGNVIKSLKSQGLI
jgi:hypothetical protein